MLAYNPVTFYQNYPFGALSSSSSSRSNSKRRHISPRSHAGAVELHQRPKVATKLFNLVNSYQIKISKNDSDFSDFLINLRANDEDEELELLITSTASNFEKLFNFNINEIQSANIDYEINDNNMVVIIPKAHAYIENYQTNTNRGRKLSSKNYNISKRSKKNQLSARVLQNLGNVHVPEYHEDRSQGFPIVFNYSSAEEEESDVSETESEQEEQAEIFHLELENSDSSDSDSETDEEIEFDSEDSDTMDVVSDLEVGSESDVEYEIVATTDAPFEQEEQEEEQFQASESESDYTSSDSEAEAEAEVELEHIETVAMSSESESESDSDSEEEEEEVNHNLDDFYHFESETYNSDSESDFESDSESESDSDSEIFTILPKVSHKVFLEEVDSDSEEADFSF